MAYRDDPKYRELLKRFQTAAWEECLENINQLLDAYPEDEYLLAFKQDVEMRFSMQRSHEKRDAEEASERRRKLRSRTLIIGAVVLALVGLVVWGGRLYQAQSTRARAQNEASLTAESRCAPQACR